MVYGLHTIYDRKSLWEEFERLGRVSNEPMIFIGDFNAVLSVEDRLNGAAISEQETQDFVEFMSTSHMLEAPSCGLFYSWSNKGLGNLRICSRIDKTIITDSMLELFPEMMVKYQPCGISDHIPLVVTFQPETQVKGRPFKFLNILADDRRFLDVVTEAWRNVNEHHHMKRV